mgnify:CR=1 FL=1
MKTCITCRFYMNGNVCSKAEFTDLVTGEKNYFHCYIVRSVMAQKNECGPEGKLWRPHFLDLQDKAEREGVPF